MTKKEKKSDSRYPYTYACDFIRSVSPWGDDGCAISRATASQIRQIISLSLGIDDRKVAEKLADMSLKYEPVIHVFNNETERFEPPEDIIGFKIVHFCGKKQAHWLQLKNGETPPEPSNFIDDICDNCQEGSEICVSYCKMRPGRIKGNRSI